MLKGDTAAKRTRFSWAIKWLKSELRSSKRLLAGSAFLFSSERSSLRKDQNFKIHCYAYSQGLSSSRLRPSARIPRQS